MKPMQAEQFTVELTPLPTASRVAGHRKALRWRIISSIVSLLALIVVLVILRPDLSRSSLVAIFSPWLVLSIIWIGATARSLAKAKRDLSSISHGPAVTINREGMEFHHPKPVRASWSEISALKVSGQSFGAGPNLMMVSGDTTLAQIPVSFLDAMPSAIDSAVTAHSLGRVRLDVSDMDKIL